jgi:hypothetical protein
MDWLRGMGGALSPYSTGWPRTVKEVLTPSEKDQLN